MTTTAQPTDTTDTTEADTETHATETNKNDSKIVTAYIATYDTTEDAHLDFAALKKLGHDNKAGYYDAALVEKNAKGKLHITKKERATQLGTSIGLLAGALIGVVVPPVLLVEVALGGVTGGLIGHFAKGMDRDDAVKIGEKLSAGQASIIVANVGHNPKDGTVDKSLFARANNVEQTSFNINKHHLENSDTEPETHSES